MALDTAVLATTVVTSFLMPYAKAGLEKVAESVGEQVGEKAAAYVTDLTGKVWSRVKSAFSASKEQAALELFQDNPDEMKAMLIKALQEKLAGQPDLAQALAELIEAPGPDGQSSGAQIMNAAIAGIADLRGANLAQAQNITISGVTVHKKTEPDP